MNYKIFFSTHFRFEHKICQLDLIVCHVHLQRLTLSSYAGLPGSQGVGPRHENPPELSTTRARHILPRPSSSLTSRPVPDSNDDIRQRLS